MSTKETIKAFGMGAALILMFLLIMAAFGGPELSQLFCNTIGCGPIVPGGY